MVELFYIFLDSPGTGYLLKNTKFSRTTLQFCVSGRDLRPRERMEAGFRDQLETQEPLWCT